VSVEDQVRLPGSTLWLPVAELPTDGAPGHSLADYHWYMLAAVLAVLLVLFGPTWPTALMVVGTVSAHGV
jgi:hypothetical protein